MWSPVGSENQLDPYILTLEAEKEFFVKKVFFARTKAENGLRIQLFFQLKFTVLNLEVIFHGFKYKYDSKTNYFNIG